MGGLRVFCSFRAILLRSLDGMTSWSHVWMLYVVYHLLCTHHNIQCANIARVGVNVWNVFTVIHVFIYNVCCIDIGLLLH